jgi:cyclophilin family peptidyl-prolyl cis-trans isomerase/FKBP-type peptidyl-prolyl cis-trans isomerase 2
MKKLGLLFLIVFMVSCTWNNVEKSNDTDGYSQIWIKDSNSGTNLSNNIDTKMWIQTEWLQNGDKVAVMKTTNGTIKIKLFTNIVPKTTTNFIALSKKWYYKDVTFHRVIKDFMIQWWDPDGTGMWWVSIYGEKFDDEFSPELKNIKYSISMANSWKNTNGSQFFINEANNNFLDNKHSVFGQVVEWMDNVDIISKVKTDSKDKPVKEVKIISIDIMEYNNGTLKDYAFDLDKTLKEIEAQNKVKNEAKRSKVVTNGDTVSVHYTGKFEDGKKFDSSYDRWEPLSFQVWAKQMIAWFDAWVVGMKIWDKKTLKLAPKDAYGEYDAKNIQDIPKDQLKSFTDAWIKLEVWTELPTQMWNLKIIKVTDKIVTIDANNPMAGKTLNFDIELVDIK